jgi:hypothetical protein
MPDAGQDTREATQRRRARWGLAGAVGLVVVVVAVIGLVLAHRGTHSSSAVSAPAHGPGQAYPGQPVPTSTPSSRPSRQQPGRHGRWDVATENKIAAEPMIQFPTDAGLPHTLSSKTAGPAIHLPKATKTAGRLVDTGFPDTPQGALAQLKALDETGLEGLDPAAYKQAYQSVALPGAPPVGHTRLYRGLQAMRSEADLPPTGGAGRLQDAGYEVSEGLIKGTADHGRFAVVCVLGRLHGSTSDGGSAEAGQGDCQAFRYDRREWRISPTKEPAKAPNTWPGSKESVKANYRPVVSK